MTTSDYSVELTELLKEYEENLNNVYSYDETMKNYDIKKLTSLKNKIPYDNLTGRTYKQYYRVLHKYKILNISVTNFFLAYLWVIMFLLVLFMLGLLNICSNPTQYGSV